MPQSQRRAGTKPKTPSSEPLNIRIRPATRALIDRAADLLGATRTDFIVQASERRAEEVLLDRTLFAVGPEAYAEFIARLDGPPVQNDRLKHTMETKAPWEAS